MRSYKADNYRHRGLSRFRCGTAVHGSSVVESGGLRQLAKRERMAISVRRSLGWCV